MAHRSSSIELGLRSGIGLLLVALSASPQGHAAPAAGPRAEELQLQLARSERFYMELDPSKHSLRLQLEGVPLHTYPLLAVEAAVPRIAFVPRSGAPPLPQDILPTGRLEPARPEMRMEILPPPADADSTTPPLQLPPRLDEMPVPWTYRLHFGDDCVLVVTSPRRVGRDGPAALLGILHDKLVEAAKAFSSRGCILRLTLQRSDAEHLYRALPPETGLLLLPSWGE